MAFEWNDQFSGHWDHGRDGVLSPFFFKLGWLGCRDFSELGDFESWTVMEFMKSWGIKNCHETWELQPSKKWQKVIFWHQRFRSQSPNTEMLSADGSKPMPLPDLGDENIHKAAILRGISRTRVLTHRLIYPPVIGHGWTISMLNLIFGGKWSDTRHDWLILLDIAGLFLGKPTQPPPNMGPSSSSVKKRTTQSNFRSKSMLFGSLLGGFHQVGR